MIAETPGHSAPASLAIRGELTIYTAADWRDKLLALPSAPSLIELDLAEVSEMDTAGLQLLLAARREWEQNGRRLCLLRPASAVQDLLAFCRLDTLFTEQTPKGTDTGEIPS